MTTSSTRHIACTTCRDRKVRCDGVRPYCARCVNLGIHCVYRSPVKQEVSSSLKGFMEDLFRAIPSNLEHQWKAPNTNEETCQQVFKPENGVQSNPPDDMEVTSSSNESCSDSSIFSSTGNSSSAASSINDYSYLSTSNSCEALTSLDELAISQTCMDSLVYQGLDQSFLQTAPSLSLSADFEELDSQILSIMNQGLDENMLLDTELFQLDQCETAAAASISPSSFNDIPPDVLDDLYISPLISVSA